MGKNKQYCRIQGVIHNLSDVQEVLDGKSTKSITLIMYEDHGMEAVDANVFEAVIKFNGNEIPADYDTALEQLRQHNRERQPKCPTCGSRNVGKTSLIEQISIVPKIFKCEHCGYRW